MERFALLSHVVRCLGTEHRCVRRRSHAARPADSGVALKVVIGNGQQGTVGEQLPTALVVELKNENGDPVAGRKVAFLRASADTAEAFDPDTAITNGDGQAFTRWKSGHCSRPVLSRSPDRGRR